MKPKKQSKTTVILKHLHYLFKLYTGKVTTVADYTSSILLLFACLGSLTLLVYQFGFYSDHIGPYWFYKLRPYLFALFFWGMALRYALHFKELSKAKFFFIHILLFLLIPFLSYLFKHYGQLAADAQRSMALPSILQIFMHRYFSYSLLFALTIIHLSQMIFIFFRRKIKISRLFIISFLILIFVGVGLLLLPKSTYNGVSFVDALFTATSAVCVTGLTTVNIAQTFTLTGQLIILILIQVGGIGVITFTSFFALSFVGNASVNSQMILKDMLNEKKIGNLFKALISIIAVTFLLEGIGAYMIYRSIEGSMPTQGGDIYISVFHSISAYCNAGISPLEDNLGGAFLGNHYMHLWVSCLIILGGIGFPIVLNYMRLAKHVVLNIFKYITGKQVIYRHEPHIIHLHTYLVISTTAILVVGGTLFFYFAERNNTLSGLTFGSRVIESLFYAVTPRTAGFYTYNTASLTAPALLVTIVLMFVGASPMSTGGGIKTTSLAVAFLTSFHIIRGEKEVEVRGRRLEPSIIRQAFTIIILFVTYVFIVTLIISAIEDKIGRAHV